jgi:hypothetical protein
MACSFFHPAREVTMIRRFSTLAAGLALLTAVACDAERSTPLEQESVLVPLFAHEAGAAHAATSFQAHASGREEVPPNPSRAQGQATFRLSRDGDALRYRLIVANIQNVTQAHIHLAPVGQNGGVVAWLYPGSPPAQLIPGRSQGVLGEGTITSADLVGSLAGGSLDDLLAALESGGAYVNVHTSQYPGGEVRGQIR